MRIIEIKAQDNGGHRNQTSTMDLVVPENWAVIPDELETPNFPFGEVEVKKIDGVMTVTKWIAGTIPEPTPEPIPEPKTELSTDDLATAILEGVNEV